MKCIVTGGAGFIGSNLTDKLIDKGWDIIILDNLSTGNSSNINQKCQFYNVDITDYDSIECFFKDIDFVFHLAALPRIQPSFDEPLQNEKVNVIGTINCILAAKQNNIKKFIFSSSSACYGNPKELPTTEKAQIKCLSPYALQKYSAEQYGVILGERYGIPFVALRYFNVYGPRSFNEKNPFNAYTSVIGIFHNQKKYHKPLTITGNGEQSRDFVHVYDVAKANICAAKAKISSGIYNIGCGKDYSIKQIADMFKWEKKYIPERKGEAIITLADISKAKNELNWQPEISLKQGMELLDA